MNEDSFTVTFYQTYKVNITASNKEVAAEYAEIAISQDPKLYLTSIDYEVEYD
jgi:hypothetical protein